MYACCGGILGFGCLSGGESLGATLILDFGFWIWRCTGMEIGMGDGDGNARLEDPEIEEY